MYDLKDPPKNLYHLMEKSLVRGSLMGCAIEVRRSSPRRLSSLISKRLLD